ncbi:MAG: N-acetylmuramoyl-L-alanine amidase [Candidatus Omnitrophica bacterium]|nr:N-acetylmuramoyl-L-alanine amidase [Candidatus Omnitrophota bacterium]
MSVNHLDDPTKIKSGQKLTIPNVQGAKPIIPLYPNSRWTHIVIHHTATHEGNAFTIDQIHHRRGFWNGLGYHFLINNGTDGKEDGQIEVGPRWVKQMQGAHANAAGMNEHGIGISLVGNFSERRVSRAELNALVFLVKTLQQYYKIPFINVIRHGDVPGKNTECPGNNFPWAEFKELIDR